MYQDWMEKIPVIGDIEIEKECEVKFEENYCPMCGRNLKEE